MDEKLEKLLQDETFLQTLLSKETDAEVQAFLKENEIELTLEEIAAVKAGVEASLSSDSEELSAADLENVVGGASADTIGKIVNAVCDAIGKVGDLVHKWTRGRW